MTDTGHWMTGADSMLSAEAAPRPPGFFGRLLGRETSGRPFVPQIDGLRFFAIAAVMVFHFTAQLHGALEDRRDPLADRQAGSWLFAAADAGQVGVPLFFAISGLVLALPFARRHLRGGGRVNLRSYFVRRATRIEPPYVIAMCGLFLLQVADTRGAHVGDRLRHLGYSLAYLHNARYHARSTINGVAWSLEVEVQFYLLAPLLTQVFRLRPTWLRRAAIAAAMVVTAAARPHLRDPFRGFTLAHQLHYFLAGFLLADLSLLDWARPARRPGAWDLAAVAGWIGVVTVMLRTPYTAQQFLLPWLMLVVYVAAFRGRCWRWVVCQPFVYVIGGMCYTIYLYHWVIAGHVLDVTTRVHVSHNYSANGVAQMLAAAAATVAACAVLFAALEKPFMRRDVTTRVLRWIAGRPAKAVDPHAPVPGLPVASG